MLPQRLATLDNAVIPGFYGSMPNDTIKTFSRGGSDVTGSIVAAAVNADLYENWTDVFRLPWYATLELSTTHSLSLP